MIIEINRAGMQVTVDGKPATFVNGKNKTTNISNRDYNVLIALAESKGQFLTRKQLILKCWENEFRVERVVDIAITFLRKILGKDAIISRIGTGYKLADHIEVIFKDEANVSIENIMASKFAIYEHKDGTKATVVDKVRVGDITMFLLLIANDLPSNTSNQTKDISKQKQEYIAVTIKQFVTEYKMLKKEEKKKVA